LLLDDFVPQGIFAILNIFTAAITSYLALGVIPLFTCVPKASEPIRRPSSRCTCVTR